MGIKAWGERMVDNHFHALTHPNYRYFWTGQCVSLIGTWMQNIGQSWLVLTLTGSPLLLGLVGTIQFLPITCFSLFAGTLIDKFPKKNILIVTQTISMLLALLLSLMVFTDTIKYEYILVFALILGLTNTFDLPTRQSFNIEIVGKEDLMNAIALNSMTFNLARILGPSIGAAMMALLGPGWCFLLNGISFLAVLYGLTRIKTTPYVRAKKKDVSIFKEIKDGMVYIARDNVLALTLLLVTIIGTFAFNFSVLIPVFTKGVLQMDERTYGLLMSCLGVGSLIGALTVSLRSKKGPNMKVIVVASMMISLFLFLIGLTKSSYLAGLFLACTGIFNILFSTNCNSTLQIHSKDEYRARVMSVYSLVFAGSAPVGNLFAGFIADRFGADGAYLACGLMCFVPCVLILILFRKRKAVSEGQAAM
ncbi:MFS transporter [Paenibacillus sp. NPDC056579]|uniref:MFS transporter n=1 Tax=Paenibacillus sp. NPDC056579 TaxID=3345871 RepID=UPI00367AEC8A